MNKLFKIKPIKWSNSQVLAGKRSYGRTIIGEFMILQQKNGKCLIYLNHKLHSDNMNIIDSKKYCNEFLEKELLQTTLELIVDYDKVFKSK